MHLAEMGPNMHIQNDSNLGSQDMDWNHNWTNDVQQKYSSKELANANDFVWQVASSNNFKSTGKDNEINYYNLNKKQEKKYSRELKTTLTILYQVIRLLTKTAETAETRF
jgi:hypothetical protein